MKVSGSEFRVKEFINGNILGKGRGKSKKAAEQQAAREALILLKKGSRVQGVE
jgi:dsRNA-specific ribonuclease